MRVCVVLLLLGWVQATLPPSPPTQPQPLSPPPAWPSAPPQAGCTDACSQALFSFVQSWPTHKSLLPLPDSLCSLCGRSGSCPTQLKGSAFTCTASDATLQDCNEGGPCVNVSASISTLLCTPVYNSSFVAIVVCICALGVALTGGVVWLCLRERRLAIQKRVELITKGLVQHPLLGQLPR